MALLKNNIIEIIYSLQGVAMEQYRGVLTDTQIESLESSINKTFMITNAYQSIGRITGSKDKIEFSLNIYSSAEDQKIIESKAYSFVPSVEDNSDNFIKQAYVYLKSLPEFEGAVDC